ncbi:radical SAM protein [bacterium]|nr:radical SAM protein [bacterium]
MLAFGPVPSRRLGQSLGINNIPPKICSYSCVYCQLGKTLKMRVEREAFYKPERVLKAVEKKIKDAKDKGEPIDYLAFVPDGEPTIEINLGEEIELLKTLGIKVAVITNSSLIWHDDVKDALLKADWVSFKIDAVSKNIWRRINRPFRSLKFEKILEGIKEFSTNFEGEIATETMLIQGINDSLGEVEKVAHFIGDLKGVKSYISIPTRPPAEIWVKPSTEHIINMAYQVFNEKSIKVEYLIGYEGNAFAFTGNIEDDILSITSVHPMREEAVEKLLNKADDDWSLINRLLAEDKLIEVEYQNNKFYLKKIIRRR